jgi:hypothetical protein
MFPYEDFGVSIIILAVSTTAILCLGAFHYLKKRLEHKHIPLSAVVAPGLLVGSPWSDPSEIIAAAFVIGGFGAYRVVRRPLNCRSVWVIRPPAPCQFSAGRAGVCLLQPPPPLGTHS